jgi:two-component system, response regulator PdtaR
LSGADSVMGKNGSVESCAVAGADEAPLPILLVEDEIFIRIANAEWLRDAGYAVIEAANAQEALDVLESGARVALVATDVTMPGQLDGLGLAASVRSTHPGLPVILLSAHVPDDIAPYADAALHKPYSPYELTAVVASLIGKGDEKVVEPAC